MACVSQKKYIKMKSCKYFRRNYTCKLNSTEPCATCKLYKKKMGKPKPLKVGKNLKQITMNFGSAFEAIKTATLTDVENKNPKGMRLPQWQPDVIIRVQKPDEHSKMTAPYLYVESRFGKVPWKETMIELFSEKWELAD